MINIKNIFTLLALFCAIPGAWLSFKRAFFSELIDQMLNFGRHSTTLQSNVASSYKILAYLFVGKKNKWPSLLTSSPYDLWEKDKTVSLRILIWFGGVFVFSFLSCFFE